MMKSSASTKTLPFAAIMITMAVTSSFAQRGGRQGMPPEVREQIHALFDGHAAIHREVKITAEGYRALTESDDPKVAIALKEHVQQMSARLASGLHVRRWDPAFAEYCDHYEEMKHEFTTTDKGVQMTVKGRTAEAVKVAQNHAKIISAFTAHGWDEHDKPHAAVVK